MKPAVPDASARQHSGEPSPVRGRGGSRTNRPGRTEVDQQIAELVERSTHELRLAWRQWHRTEPPQGLSRDLLIRALAHQLQERTQGGASRALGRRLHRLTGELEKDGGSFDPRLVPKIGTTLAREWRGRTHVVRVAPRERSQTCVKVAVPQSGTARLLTDCDWPGSHCFIEPLAVMMSSVSRACAPSPKPRSAHPIAA